MRENQTNDSDGNEHEYDSVEIESWENTPRTPQEWEKLLLDVYPDFPGNIQRAGILMSHLARGVAEAEALYRDMGLKDLLKSRIATMKEQGISPFFCLYIRHPLVVAPLPTLLDFSSSSLDEDFEFKSPHDTQPAFYGTLKEFTEDAGREQSIHNILRHNKGSSPSSSRELIGAVPQATYDSSDVEFRSLIPKLILARKAGYRAETIEIMEKRIERARKERRRQHPN